MGTRDNPMSRMREIPRKKFMELAIREARKNLTRMDGGPFGACVVKGNTASAAARNTVLAADATCHAEINAIRAASRKAGTFDLSGCVLYSTTEPCPMCFAAIHWAKIDTIIYGTRIRDVARRGFNELTIGNSRMKRLGRSKVKIVSGFLRGECAQLLREWDALNHKVLY
jgi:guanine deaminase